MLKIASKEENGADEEIQEFKLQAAHDLADEYKAKIQQIFQSTFSV